MTKGHTEDGVFHPHTESKGIHSSQINQSGSVSMMSSKGEMQLKKVKERKGVGSLTSETRNLAEKKIGSDISRHSFGNNYEFENGDEYVILNNSKQAHKEAVKYLDNIWDAMGILGWNQSYIESFIPESMLEQKLGVSYKEIYDGKNGEPNHKLAKSVPIDKKKLFEESIKTDGVGRSLATFDDKEIELSNGSLMYRVS